MFDRLRWGSMSAKQHCDEANVLLDLNKIREAVLEFGKAINLAPALAEAWSGRGSAFNQLQRWELAVKDCSKAIELDPGDPAAY